MGKTVRGGETNWSHARKCGKIGRDEKKGEKNTYEEEKKRKQGGGGVVVECRRKSLTGNIKGVGVTESWGGSQKAKKKNSVVGLDSQITDWERKNSGGNKKEGKHQYKCPGEKGAWTKRLEVAPWGGG